jgi:hypothetical protein
MDLPDLFVNMNMKNVDGENITACMVRRVSLLPIMTTIQMGMIYLHLDGPVIVKMHRHPRVVTLLEIVVNIIQP